MPPEEEVDMVLLTKTIFYAHFHPSSNFVAAR
jgi:hypothetical protein